MHLREARIDLQGRIPARGTVHYPHPDTAGFELGKHDCVLLTTTEQYTELQPATAVRDPKTGFFRSETAGPHFLLPRALHATLRPLLAYNPNPEIALTHSGGEPSGLIPGNPEGARQPLSDWRLKVSGSTDLEVHVSVALTGNLYRVLRSQNHWPIGARAEISFTVDNATRALAFGGIGPQSTTATSPPEPLRKSSREDLSLEATPIGPASAMFGFSSAGTWVQVYDSPMTREGMGFTPSRTPLRREADGFIKNDQQWAWPRINIRGIGLSTLVSMLKYQDRITIAFYDGSIGTVSFDDGRFRDWDPPYPHQPITLAALVCSIGDPGLTIEYTVKVDGRKEHQGTEYGARSLQGDVTLPWEILLIKYPELLKKRPLQ